MDDALTIAKRFVEEPTNIRDLELSILRHMEHHISKADLRWIDEIKRLRNALRDYADWIEQVYGRLPKDEAPGPPTEILNQMRATAGTE